MADFLVCCPAFGAPCGSGFGRVDFHLCVERFLLGECADPRRRCKANYRWYSGAKWAICEQLAFGFSGKFVGCDAASCNVFSDAKTLYCGPDDGRSKVRRRTV